MFGALFSSAELEERINFVVSPSQARVKRALACYENQRDHSGRVRRSGMTTSVISGFISQTWMVERLDNGQYCFRLFSGRSSALADVDMTGKLMPLDGAFRPWPPIYDTVLHTGEPTIVQNHLSESGADFLLSECVLLPLDDEKGCARYIMGVYDIIEGAPGLE